jgi:spore coat polysaccharide biosynthesis protein SpsF (cytidylyltransferase family)
MTVSPGDVEAPPLVLIAARMSSQRLPGKTLMLFGDDPLLGHVVSAASHAQGTSGVVVVTSVHPSDDPIAEWCVTEGVAYWRGPLDDVASRMAEAAEHYGAEGFVRISGDSPMLDPAIVAHACSVFSRGSYDLVTNVNPRAFPPGQSVEVIRTSVLNRLLHGGDVTQEDREHVTTVLYRNPDHLRVQRFGPADIPDPQPSVHTGREFTDVSLTIDTAEDAARFRAILQGLKGELAWRQGWYRCIELARQASLRATSTTEETDD